MFNRVSLRHKTALFIILMALLFASLAYCWLHFTLSSCFKRLERLDLKRSLTCVSQLFLHELNHLENTAKDWAFWDDTYEYVQNRNESYKKSNLVPDAFEEAHLNLIVIANAQGQIIYKQGWDFQHHTSLFFKKFNKTKLGAEIPIFKLLKGKVIKGFYLTQYGPLFMVICPILRTNQQGPPKGILIMGRLLNQNLINTLNYLGQGKISVYPLNSFSFSPEIKKVFYLLKHNNLLILPVNSSLIAGYKLIYDLNNQPAFIFKIEKKRSIHNLLIFLMKQVIIIFICITLLAAGIGYIFHERIFLRPLLSIASELRSITSFKDLRRRVCCGSKRDEIGMLANSINYTLEQIEKGVMNLEESRRWFENLFQSIRDMVFVCQFPPHNESLKFIQVNKAVCSKLGYTPEELMQMSPVDITSLSQTEIKQMLDKADQNVFEVEIRTKDGRMIPVELNVSMFDLRHQRLGIAVCRDISDRKEAEQKIEAYQKSLLAERMFLESILRNLNEAVLIVDRNFHVIMANAQAEKMIMAKQDELIDMPLFNIMELQDETSCKSCLKEVIEHPKPIWMCKEIRFKYKNERPYLVEISMSPFKDDRGEVAGVILVMKDVSERKRMEEELSYMQKLGALGIVAGGIAHEFNNLLMGVFGNISLAKATLEIPQKSSIFLERAEEALIRSRELTQRLLTLTEEDIPFKKEIKIDAILSQVVLETLSNSSINPNFDIKPNLWPIKGDKEQISQVVKQLVLNAAEAMEQKGNIYIRAENIEIGEDSISEFKKGRYVKVSIRDEGEGISLEEQKKIFIPFYTTKSKRVGLGLSLCYAVIKRHGGWISVFSEKGKGSTFTFYLPSI